ncbi:CsbD family protein [Aquabacter sp. CN5-332]|uniref:CsbD family protein n=1 Tax=Aquabacter sp. CN5-332 TaxID=3156608 RepID=UPI0032B4007F
MGSTNDKIKGSTNEVIGNAKQGVGKAVGNDRMEAEGKMQEVKGEGQKAMGKAKEAVKDTVNRKL